MPACKPIIFAVLISTFTSTAAWACEGIHIVERGDTLAEIAQYQVGSVFDLQTLYNANRRVIGPDPNLIKVGMALTLPCGASEVNPIDWSVMPSPETLAVLLQSTDVQILDVRSEKDVAGGTIPGSITIPFDQWRGPEENPGEPPSEERLSEIIGEAGLKLDVPIIIIHAEPTIYDTGEAAFVYWLLKSSGAETLAILRGGFDGWTDAELQTTNKIVAQEPYELEVKFSWEWRADQLDVFGIASGQIQGHLLDARPHSIFKRFDALARSLETTLPTATSAPVQPLLAILSGEIDVADGVQTVIDHLGSYKENWREGSVVSFCDSGVLAALNWFYASEMAGLSDMKLYPESVRGWTATGGSLFVGKENG